MFKEITNTSNNSANISLRSADKANNKTYICKEYSQGQIICGKVGKYPWWPSMVNAVSNDKEYVVLVSYFGKPNDYSYLTKNNTLNIATETDYNEYLNEFVIGKKAKKKYKTYKSSLENAWKEAEDALKLDVKARMEKYKIKCTIKENTNIPKRHNRRPKSKTEIQQKSVKPQEIKEKEPIKYGFTELTLPFASVKSTRKNCRYCLETKDVVQCNMGCNNNFHLKCVEILKESIGNMTSDLNICLECSSNTVRCFGCYKLVDVNSKNLSIRCIIKTCQKWYHSKCLDTGHLLEMTKFPKSGQLVCPCHICHKCELVNPSPKYRCTRLVACIMCPSTFHTGDWCIPAGSIELNQGEIICPRHLLDLHFSIGAIFPPFVGRVKSKLQEQIYGNKLTSLSEPMTILPTTIVKPKNVNWCFKCGIGGELLCCETCPASYHLLCVDLKEVPHNFYCPDCQSFCFRSYGEIVWIKCGTHPWWPGQIMHLDNVPKNIISMKHVNGQFVVQFFGTRDYMWRDHGSVFLFEKEDEYNTKTEKYRFNQLYMEGIKEAAAGYTERELTWQSGSSNHVMNSKLYNKIQVNRCPIQLKRRHIQIPHCACNPADPKSDCSIGSGCFNVESKYECNPESCNLKDRCKNQNFVKRNYPKQYTFWSNDRGWGLKTEEFIKKRQFVNEYVGEIITTKESDERIIWANENNITDFYFMEIDNSRLIDARNYSNLSRFINHSCDPNLIAEKWLVNEDYRIGLFALRDIAKDEELTFKYNLQNKSSNRIVCKCFSSNCTGFLGDPPKKAKETKKPLKSHSKSINKIKCETAESESSCKSFLTDKNCNSHCFRCGDNIDMVNAIVCSVGPCLKMYHAQCLNLNIENYDLNSWICPHHYCDICAQPSYHFSANSTESYCDKDFLIKYNMNS